MLRFAFAWLAEVEHTTTLAGQPPYQPEKKTPPPVRFKPTDDGGAQVSYWIQHRPGMRPITSYSLATVTFAADGSPGSPSYLDRCEVRMDER